MNTDEYLKGMRDCKNGKPARLGMSDDYYDGYSCQYEAEQALTELGLRNEPKRSQQRG